MIIGGTQDWPFSGDQNDNTLHGPTDADRMCGKDGNDSLYSGADFDTRFRGGAVDDLYGGIQEDELRWATSTQAILASRVNTAQNL